MVNATQPAEAVVTLFAPLSCYYGASVWLAMSIGRNRLIHGRRLRPTSGAEGLVNMIRDSEWHERRSRGIGGSDAAAILGISPFKSPLKLWMEKRGELPQDDLDSRENIYWGITLERIIREEYERRTGRDVREATEIAVHPQYPWMICNVDGFVNGVGPRVIVEIKNVSVYAAGDWGQDGTATIPPYYLTQAQHNMEVTGALQCELPVLIGGNDYRCYHVPRDAAFGAMLVEREGEFWESVKTGVKPQPINLSDLKLLFPDHTPGIHIDADEETAQAWAKLAEIKLAMKRLKAENKDSEFVVKKAMGEAERLSFNGVTLCTWKTSKGGRRTFRVQASGVSADESEGDSDD